MFIYHCEIPWLANMCNTGYKNSPIIDYNIACHGSIPALVIFSPDSIAG